MDTGSMLNKWSLSLVHEYSHGDVGAPAVDPSGVVTVPPSDRIQEFIGRNLLHWLQVSSLCNLCRFFQRAKINGSRAGIRATLVFRFRHDCDVIKELDLVR